MEAKVSQKGIQESMFFWLGFGMALETLIGLRRVREWGTFSSGSPRAALARAGLSNKNRQRRAWLRDLTRLEPLARRIVHVFRHSGEPHTIR